MELVGGRSRARGPQAFRFFMGGLDLVAGGNLWLNRELCVLSWIQLLVEWTGQHDVSLITGQCVGFL